MGEVLFAELAQDQAEHDPRNRVAGAAQEEGEDAGCEHDADVHHQVAHRVGTDRGQQQDRRREELEGDAQQVQHGLGLEEAEHQDGDVGEEHGSEDDPHQLRRVDEDQGTGLDVVHLKDADHHGGQGAARQAERQERYHGGAGRGVVGGLRGDHALQFALAEVLLVLGPAHRLVVAEEGGEGRADAGQDAGEEAEDDGAEDGEPEPPELQPGWKGGHELGHLVGAAHSALGLHQHLGDREKAQDDGNEVETGQEIDEIEGVALYARDRIEPDGRQEQAEQN